MRLENLLTSGCPVAVFRSGPERKTATVVDGTGS